MPVPLLAMRKSVLEKGVTTKTFRYLLTDHLGSTSVVTERDGTIYAQQRYLPFGAPRWSDGNALPTDRTYTGQRAESFGLMDYNARFYSPVLHRFISADTLVPEPGNPLD